MRLRLSNMLWGVIGTAASSILYFAGPRFVSLTPVQRILLALTPLLALAIVLLLLLALRTLAKSRMAGPKAEPAEPAKGDLIPPERKEKLEHEMAQALGPLKKNMRSIGGSGKRSLNDYRFFLVLGPENAGKSRLLDASGLAFLRTIPEPRADAKAGFPPSHWWMTKKDVFVEPPRRYFQDAIGKKEFIYWLSLLAKSGKSESLDGILLVLDIREILKDEGTRERQASMAREWILQVMETVRLVLPVYLVFTHVEAFPGGEEMLRPLSDAQDQPFLGATFALHDQEQQPESLFEGAYRTIWEALDSRFPARLPKSGKPENLVNGFRFLAEFGAAMPCFAEFVKALFRPEMHLEPFYFRGFFFSGMLGRGKGADKGLGAAAAVARDADISMMDSMMSSAMSSMMSSTMQPSDSAISEMHLSPAFFRKVLAEDYKDQRLARIPTSLQGQMTRKDTAWVAAAWLLTLVAGTLLILGFLRNGRMAAATESALQAAAKINWGLPTDFSRKVEVLQRLHATRDSMAHAGRWTIPPGVDHGDEAEALLRDMEIHQLSRMIGADAFQNLKAELRLVGQSQMARDYSETYARLKLYLCQTILVRPHWREVDEEDLARSLARFWQMGAAARFGSENLPDGMEDVFLGWARFYVGRLKEDGSDLLGAADASLVESVRQVLRGSPSVQEFYRKVIASAAHSESLGLLELGIPAASMLKGGNQVNRFYTKAAYAGTAKEILMQGAERQFTRDWVLGESGSKLLSPELRDKARLKQALLERYFEEYAREWWAFLERLAIQPPMDLRQAASGLAGYVSPGEGLPALLARLAEETDLSRNPGPAEGLPGNSQLRQAAQAFERIGAQDARTLAVDRKFSFVRALRGDAAGAGGLQEYLAAVKSLADEIATLASKGDDDGGILGFTQGFFKGEAGNALFRAWTSADAILARTPEEARAWIRTLFVDPLRVTAELLVASTQSGLESAFRKEVLDFYDDRLKSRFPLEPTSGRDIQANDLKTFFDPAQGQLALFIKGRLMPFIQSSQGRMEARTVRNLRLGFTPAALQGLEQGLTVSSRFFNVRSGDLRTYGLELTLFGEKSVSESFFRIGEKRIAIKGPGRMVQSVQWPEWVSKEGVEMGVTQLDGRTHAYPTQGQWGLLRLLQENAMGARLGGGFNLTRKFTVNKVLDVPLRVLGRPEDEDNPFTVRDFYRFECPTGLFATASPAAAASASAPPYTVGPGE